MKRIIFNLKWPWYCQIANGEKLIEYRQVKPYWHSRLIKGIRNFTGELIPRIGMLYFVSDITAITAPIQTYCAAS